MSENRSTPQNTRHGHKETIEALILQSQQIMQQAIAMMGEVSGAGESQVVTSPPYSLQSVRTVSLNA